MDAIWGWVELREAASSVERLTVPSHTASWGVCVSGA